MHTCSLARVIGVLLAPLTVLAIAAEPAQEPTLKEIMQGLRDDVFTIAAAELGPEMPAFKQLDIRVHDLSLSIITAAEAQDRERISADFGQLVNGCLACHTSYKDRVANVLNDPK